MAMATNHGMALGKPNILEKPYFEAVRKSQGKVKIGVKRQTMGRIEVGP